MNRKQRMLLLLTTIFLCFIFVQNKAQAKETISNTAINLEGASASAVYSYYLVDDVKGEANELVLQTENSSLLIKPSSLTVKIDGEKVKTTALSGSEPTKKIVIKLVGKHLKKGTHEVVFEYDGIIKEGVCVENNTSGNWLRINPSSTIQLGKMNNVKATNLAAYPAKFIAVGATTNIVIPNEASTEIVNAALKVTSYLKKQATKPKQIQLTAENEAVKEATNTIYLSDSKGFASAKINKIIEEAKIPTEKNALNLKITQQEISERMQSVLIVQADTAKIVDERVAVLANNQLANQLQGQELSIQTMPTVNQINGGTVRFQEMTIDAITLSNAQPSSVHYYYNLPKDLDREQVVTLKLQLKKSTVFKNAQSELVVFINSIPHSVNLKDVKIAQDGYIKTNVAVSKEALENKSLLDLQFTLNGVKQSNPCATNHRENWLFISEKSELNYSPTEKTAEMQADLASFPSFLMRAEQSNYVLIDKLETTSLDELLDLYMISTNEGETPNIQLKEISTVKETELEKHHLLFVGDAMNLQKALQKDHPAYTDDKFNLAEAGFIEEAATRFATIQTNPWNKNFVAMQFNHSDEQSKILTMKYLQQLQAIETPASIAVQINSSEIFTNAQSFKSASTGEGKNSDKITSTFNGVSIVLFIALLAIVAGLIFIVMRKRKK